jgi:hypothetical protein
MRRLTIALLLLLTLTPFARAEDPTTLNDHLKVFAPLLGKTWKGTFSDSTPEKPMIDTARWERAMNGQAIRCLHSVNEGIYGGETIIMWDPKQEKLAFWYFTTAGFFTQGTLEITDNTWTATEEVTGNANGITKVRSTATINPDGSFQTKAEYYTKDTWSPGHAIHYTPTENNAPIIFK